MQSPELVSTIAAGAHLAGSSRTEATSDLKSVLTSRLTQYEQTLGRSPTDRSDKTLEEVQLETASEALHVVSLVQILINRPNDKPNETQETSTEATPQDGYMIGTRDLAYMRTLLSITVKWGLEPLLQRVTAGIPSTMPVGARKSGVQVIDLTTVPENYKLLVSLIDQLLGIILPSGVSGPIPSTHISVLILDNYLPDLFKPCITLGWLPKSQATESVMPVDHLRSVVIHLISMSVACTTCTPSVLNFNIQLACIKIHQCIDLCSNRFLYATVRSEDLQLLARQATTPASWCPRVIHRHLWRGGRIR